MAKKLYEEANIAAIADAIREKTGTETTYKPSEMAAGVGEAFEAGKKSEYDRFWDSYQNGGQRTKYEHAFAQEGWTDETFDPKYDIILGAGYCASAMFLGSRMTDVQGLLEEKGLVLDVSKSYLNQAFQQSHSVRWGVIDTAGCTVANSFYYTFNRALVETIDKLIMHDYVVPQNNVFSDCDKLVNLNVEGTIGQNGFNVQWSTLLTHDSLMSIINALKDYAEDTSGTSWVVTLGPENLAKLTDEEKAIATEKGWTLA